MGRSILQKRRIGNTDILVSILGLGTVKWGRNQGVKYPHAFAIPNDDVLQNLLSAAKDHGINLLDTAPAYGESETRLGKLLKADRSHWVLCTKAGELFCDGQSYFDFSKKAITHSVETSLKRLQTDYLDIVLIHSNGDDVNLIEHHAVLDTLNQMKEKGYIRAIGMSTKTVAGGLLTLEQADIAMVTSRPDYMDEAAVIEKAHVLQKGVLIKKAFASGHLDVSKGQESALKSLRFNLLYPAVASIVIGTISLDHLTANCQSVLHLS